MSKVMFNPVVGNIIKIYRGGPESRIGQLIDVFEDYLVLFTDEDGIVYYNTKHIKSLTDSKKEQFKLKSQVPEYLEYNKSGNFSRILDDNKLQWIRINRGGPEKLEGILYEVNKDFVALINKEEIVRVAMYHISSISLGTSIKNVNDNRRRVDQSDMSQSDQTRKRVAETRGESNDKEMKPETNAMRTSTEGVNLSEL